MANEITAAHNFVGSFVELERLAEAIAKSGMFGMKTKEQALTLMLISHAEGKHPALAARDYDVIQGRPAKRAEAMARDFLESGGKIEWHALSDTIADATFAHPQGGTVRISWDMARAATAGLAGKENYKKFPRQMLRSRTISEGVRTIWPSATSGFYEPGEIADQPSFDGPTIEAKAEPAAPDPPPPPPNGNGRKPHSIAPPAGAPDADWRECLDKVAPALARMPTQGQVEALASGPTCGDIIQFAPEWARAELSQLLADNMARFARREDGDEPPHIVGEDRMAAG